MICFFRINILFFFFIFLKTFSCVEKKIIVIIPAYNVAASIERTLSSVFTQNYSNFYVYFIDDCSQDSTVKMVQEYIKNHEREDKITCIFNKKRRRKLANIYSIVHLLENDDIVFLLDGDDWLSDNNVFSKINEIYQDSDIWMTYGNYKNVPQKEALFWNVASPKYCGNVSKDIIREKKYRNSPFVYMHPRTFYAWLFKLIHLEDLISEEIENFVGDFFPACNDKAIIFPMIEMAGNHVKFIDEVLYYRNLYSNLVGFKVDKSLQIAATEEIQQKKIYPTLRHSIKRKHKVLKKNICFVIKFVDENDIFFTLNTYLKIIDNHKVFLFYQENEIERVKKYIETKNNIKLIPYNEENVSELLNNFILRKFKYILYIDDLNYLSIINQNMLHIITWLQKTFCPVCIFGQKPDNIVHIVDNIYAYKKTLNKNLTKISAAIIETKNLQKKCHKNIKNLAEFFMEYINSDEYELGLHYIL